MIIKSSATTQYKLVKETSLNKTHKFVIYYRQFEDKKWYKRWKWKRHEMNYALSKDASEKDQMITVINNFIISDNNTVIVKSEDIEL